MMSKIGKIIATISLLGYLFALILEMWRPGFVVSFWNPQWFLVVFVGGLLLISFTEIRSPEIRSTEIRSRGIPLALRLVFAIVMAALVWTVFPSLKIAWLAAGATFFLICAYPHR